MSDLPASALDYRTVVTEYFLGLRGSGLMLSPLDAEAVGEWERRGVPIAVVCRGLRRGLEDLAERRAGGPRSIRALRFAVEVHFTPPVVPPTYAPPGCPTSPPPRSTTARS